ncbi:MAG: Uma2 family endonuclease [Candidatus Poribacteria bacterium]|nr:Uma2 family endonuclease [Candidatus Poribacteria bacterium]
MKRKIGTAPTFVYPESDGEPMAETPKHQQVMIDCMDILRNHFHGIRDVYIGGNMLLYYEEGNPRKSVSPDVFMVRGLSKKELRTYKTWEQPATLDFVLEVASPSTYTRDFNEKMEIYAKILRVKEYYIYDPYHEIEPYFVGFRLVGETYEEIAFVNARLPSSVLGLELGEHEGLLRLYDPVKSAWLLTSQERVGEAETRVAQESLARQEAETRVQHAEAELEKLRAALQRLETTK